MNITFDPLRRDMGTKDMIGESDSDQMAEVMISIGTVFTVLGCHVHICSA